MNNLKYIVLPFLSSMICPVVFAIDGVLEIDQVCALNQGCFSGDTAGYPITIDSSVGHSFRLTSDLTVPDANTHGIEVMASNISIDLNGHQIVRLGCEQATTNCAPASGLGAGVYAAANLAGISAINGGVTGMGYGIYLDATQSEAKNLRARWNRLHGIITGDDSISKGNISYENLYGVYAGNGSVVSKNVAYGNTEDGIHALDGANILNNTAYLNGGDGIDAGSGSNIQRNNVMNNALFGLQLTPDSGYRENLVTNNTAGTVASGINSGGNACDGSNGCP